MNWDDLRVFLAVARAPSIAVAASRLGIDATTVVRRLARLAAAVDTTLFEPGARGQVLTANGHKLLAYAESAEKAATDARSDLTGERGLLAGTVRISVTEGFGTWVVAQHLAEFHAANPGIRIELIATNGFLNPSKREADVAIMLARPARGALLARQLTGYRLKLYAARDYVARHGAPASRDDLRRHSLIGYVPDFIYSDELRYLDDIAKELEPTLGSSSINVQHRLTRGAAGIAVLPCFIGDTDPALLRVLDDEVDISGAFWLVVHRDVRRLARVSAFIDWIDGLVRAEQELLSGSGRRAA